MTEIAERQLHLLGRLAEAGLEVALAIEHRAKAAVQDSDIDLNGLSLAYDRVARAVRMTIALQSRLIGDLKAREAAADEERAEAEDLDHQAQAVRLETHKVRVGGVVLRVIEAEHEDDDEIRRLILKAEMLLDDEDLYDDVLNHPIGELVARICRDLGLSPDWPRLAEEAWARKEIESGAAGSPFAAWMAGREQAPRTQPDPEKARPPPFAGEVAGTAGGGIPLARRPELRA